MDPAHALAPVQHEAAAARERGFAWEEITLARSLSQQPSLQQESTETRERVLTLAFLQQLLAHDLMETLLFVAFGRPRREADRELVPDERAVQHDCRMPRASIALQMHPKAARVSL